MDRIIFLVLSLICVSFVLIYGDALYIGIWYYIAIPAMAFLLTLPFKPQKYFLSSISIVILLTYIPYYYYNLTAKQPEGLLGLGHLFSLPGLAIGIILAGIYLSGKVQTQLYTFSIGFAFSIFGFFINQIFVCSTVLYCGRIMSPLGGN